MKRLIRILIILLLASTSLFAQHHSVARRWIEVQLEAIRQDLARPPVQARNFFHVSLAMYDAWAVYDKMATPYVLGKSINNILYPYTGVVPIINADTQASREMAISYAAYRVLQNRYSISPNAASAFQRFDTLMQNLGYNTNINSTNYTAPNATPAELGNYIASQIIAMGYNDGAKQAQNYTNTYYAPINPYLIVDSVGTNHILNVNRWQPLTISGAVDQNNNPIPSNQVALCHEWGDVQPFALDPNTSTWFFRSGNIFKVYKNPGGPSILDTLVGSDSSSMHYKWANTMVTVWSAFLDPADTTLWDISPRSRGNLSTFPVRLYDQYNYYNLLQGGDTSKGHAINPATGMPYAPQIVKRGDYTRVVSQYWADGPHSETPPGHWYVIFNNISDHPLLVKQFEGQGDTLSDLDWDIKGYMCLGGAVHDAAITAWSMKGWYDSPRPISAIRLMAQYGQSSDPGLPHYHPAGLPLIPGFVELILPGDSMAIANPANLYKIKVKTWRGFAHITNPNTDVAGVGWLLAEKWIPYQRKGFVTPPFSGYVSGHSTYSRAAAEVLTKITNNPYFPGGIYETYIPANSGYLQLEQGPSTDITLQWATYRDASNEASLSRIFGGIHPPTDDTHGRMVGAEIGVGAVSYARAFFNARALPLTLQTAQLIADQCAVHINWNTIREQQVESFEIIRSINGIDNFTTIATIPAKGNSDESQSYTFTDAAAPAQAFYQIVEKDIDGKLFTLYTADITLHTCNPLADNQINIYPNPVQDLAIVQLPENAEVEQVQIINSMGEILAQLQPTKVGNKISLDTHNLTPGLYYMKIQFSSGNITSVKFNKQ